MSGLPTEHVCPVKIESPVITENRIEPPRQLTRSLWKWSLCVEGDEPFITIVAALFSIQGTSITIDNFHCTQNFTKYLINSYNSMLGW